MAPADRPSASTKRNDDFRPYQPSLLTTITSYYRQSFRSRRRVVIGLLVLVIFFIWELRPIAESLSEPTTWKPSWQGKGTLWPAPVVDEGSLRTPKPGSSLGSRYGPAPKVNDEEGFTYMGQIKFQHLAQSIAEAGWQGTYRKNRNVLFAAASLESVSSLMPLACEMAQWKRNKVHFAFLGRDQITIKMLQKLNGAEKGCESLYLHDARPDLFEKSADKRMEIAASGALKLIYEYSRPMVLILDGSSQEEAYLTNGMKSRAEELKMTTIEVPQDGNQAMQWITRLEAQTLSMWHSSTIDIIVHAPSYQSGSLIRLLRSLAKADYFGSPPRLTLELPIHLGDKTEDFLKTFKWPPQEPASSKLNTLTIRRQILRRESGEERAIRFLESFYPQDYQNSHVVVLNAQAEVSQNWFHYLKYAMLEYRYSSSAQGTNSILMGLSLEMPTTFINGKEGYEPPLSDPEDYGEATTSDYTPVAMPYLWQAPLSSATLYFGEKWAELRSFIENRYKDPTRYDPKREHLASDASAWSHYFLELARARGYLLIYPNLDDTAHPFCTVHNDQEPLKAEDQIIIDPSSLRAQQEAKAQARVDAERTQPSQEEFILDEPLIKPKSQASKQATDMYSKLLPITKVLPFNGDLPELPLMSIQAYDGRLVKMKQFLQEKEDYLAWFRSGIGRCTNSVLLKAAKAKEGVPGSADDLFCTS